MHAFGFVNLVKNKGPSEEGAWASQRLTFTTSTASVSAVTTQFSSSDVLSLEKWLSKSFPQLVQLSVW